MPSAISVVSLTHNYVHQLIFSSFLKDLWVAMDMTLLSAAYLSDPHVHMCTRRERGIARVNIKLDNLEINPNFIQRIIIFITFWIWGSHSGGYEEFYPLGYNRSPLSHRRRRKGNPVPGGYKYGDLALQVGGVSNLRE
jgi:hypothetical protein